MSNKLDQLVKGAPPPNLAKEQTGLTSSQKGAADPTSLLPSSPPQIYLNLLILEASLRAQYLSLLSRRRQNAFVLLLLAIYLGYTTYLVFLRPREDGRGVGGSVYWVLDRCQKISWLGGVIMSVLFRATGQWERGVRWPRRWLGATNRGLRRLNCKAVLLKRPWWRALPGHLAFLIPYGLLYPTPGSNFQRVEYTPSEKARLRQHQHIREKEGEIPEEDLAPGGDILKLILLPKPFSADFREEWEVFRARYWEAENTRRKALLVRVKSRQRELARKEGGWLWWTGWRGWAHLRGASGREAEKTHMSHLSLSSQQGSISGRAGPRRRESLLKERMDLTGSHSRSSSRSSIVMDNDERGIRPDRERRASSSSTASDRRRKVGLSSMSTSGRTAGLAGMPRSSSRLSDGSSRPGTPKESMAA